MFLNNMFETMIDYLDKRYKKGINKVKPAVFKEVSRNILAANSSAHFLLHFILFLGDWDLTVIKPLADNLQALIDGQGKNKVSPRINDLVALLHHCHLKYDDYRDHPLTTV